MCWRTEVPILGAINISASGTSIHIDTILCESVTEDFRNNFLIPQSAFGHARSPGHESLHRRVQNLKHTQK